MPNLEGQGFSRALADCAIRLKIVVVTFHSDAGRKAAARIAVIGCHATPFSLVERSTVHCCVSDKPSTMMELLWASN